MTSLAVLWLRLCASTAGGTGLIPGQGTKIPHATWCSQKQKKKVKTLWYQSLKYMNWTHHIFHFL